MEIKIRFNTEKEKRDATLPPWRVIVDGEEHLAERVNILTSSWTTLDEIEPGLFKWHITCAGDLRWDRGRRECTVVTETLASLPQN